MPSSVWFGQTYIAGLRSSPSDKLNSVFFDSEKLSVDTLWDHLKNGWGSLVPRWQSKGNSPIHIHAVVAEMGMLQWPYKLGEDELLRPVDPRDSLMEPQSIRSIPCRSVLPSNSKLSIRNVNYHHIIHHNCLFVRPYDKKHCRNKSYLSCWKYSFHQSRENTKGKVNRDWNCKLLI